ncbi:MAG: hypothetical protein LBI77_04065, partial [Puniceicoccales bacterium]|nr:hypothetical protein [Puniceicoccales bacterium]
EPRTLDATLLPPTASQLCFGFLFFQVFPYFINDNSKDSENFLHFSTFPQQTICNDRREDVLSIEQN